MIKIKIKLPEKKNQECARTHYQEEFICRYEEQKTRDEAAKLVKNLDKFDMILFFDSTANVFTSVPVFNWQHELLVTRDNNFAEY